MLCFWRYKVLLYPYTTQLLNYTISLHMKYYFFMMYCIFALVLGLHFCVKIFKFMPDFFFFLSHFPFISMWGHIDPEDQKCKHFFFLHTFRTTESSPVFMCVYK